MQLANITTTAERKFFQILPYGWNLTTNLLPDSLDFMLKKWETSTTALTQRSLINFLNLYSHLGISASQPLEELPPNDIRRLEGISNSQLTRLKNELQGKPERYPERCLVFGQAFHAAALEGQPIENPEWNLRPSEVRSIRHMCDAYSIEFERHTESAGLQNPEMETPLTWTDAETGLPCKAQLDLRYRGHDLVFDLKSTSALNRVLLEQTLAAYDYDRQAAFYLDGSGARSFGLVAVQKRVPFEVFILTFDRDSEFIENGRRKYRFLLKKWQEK